jgi:hypothetical protein
MELHVHSHIHLHVKVFKEAQETYFTIDTYLNKLHGVLVVSLNLNPATECFELFPAFFQSLKDMLG